MGSFPRHSSLGELPVALHPATEAPIKVSVTAVANIRLDRLALLCAVTGSSRISLTSVIPALLSGLLAPCNHGKGGQQSPTHLKRHADAKEPRDHQNDGRDWRKREDGLSPPREAVHGPFPDGTHAGTGKVRLRIAGSTYVLTTP